MLLIKPFWLKYKYHNQYLRKPSSVIDEEEDEPEEVLYIIINLLKKKAI